MYIYMCVCCVCVCVILPCCLCVSIYMHLTLSLCLDIMCMHFLVGPWLKEGEKKLVEIFENSEWFFRSLSHFSGHFFEHSWTFKKIVFQVCELISNSITLFISTNIFSSTWTFCKFVNFSFQKILNFFVFWDCLNIRKHFCFRDFF